MYRLSKITAGVCSLYILAASLGALVLIPLQFHAFPELSLLVSLIYIPAGIRVFATVLFGTQAIPGIFLGTLLSARFLSGIDSTVFLVSISVISAAAAPIVFYGLQSIGISPYYLRIEEKLPKREALLLAGFLTSVVNGFFLTTVLEHLTDLRAVSLTMAAVFVGDFIGFLVVILLAKLTVGSEENNTQ